MRRLSHLQQHLRYRKPVRVPVRALHTQPCVSTSRDGNLVVRIYSALSDNYGFLVHCKESGCTAAVDSPSNKSLLNELKTTGWELTHILVTHHHPDHTSYEEVLDKYKNINIVGPVLEKHTIPGLVTPVSAGDQVSVGNMHADVLDVSGHTLGHVAYHFKDHDILFAGDSIFPLGCGRIFEGTAKQSYDGLQRIAQLPEHTQVYCAHEYALSNARFALSVDPENENLKKRCVQFEMLRENQQPTVPTTVQMEKLTNPFLTLPTSTLTEEEKSRSPDEIFAHLRYMKDNFR